MGGGGGIFSRGTGRKKMEARPLLTFITRFKHNEWPYEFHRVNLTRLRHKGFIAPI